ncbi:hypothetical protein PFISCL1PPCAC_16084, partial [Pristionchus fissidentatus]
FSSFPRPLKAFSLPSTQPAEGNHPQIVRCTRVPVEDPDFIQQLREKNAPEPAPPRPLAVDRRLSGPPTASNCARVEELVRGDSTGSNLSRSPIIGYQRNVPSVSHSNSHSGHGIRPIGGHRIYPMRGGSMRGF